MSATPALDPRYRLDEPLGQGSQGSVWRARDLLLERDVAIKLLAPGADVRLLRQELSLLGELRHPGLATVYDLDRDASGQSYLVSELIRGEPLRRFWRDSGLQAGLEVLATLLGTLDFLHQRGVVHRDVKPDNILVERCQGLVEGNADAAPRGRLVDFGLATTAALQETGGVTGTLAYAAPEVLAGEAASPASDLYGVGMVLFEALFGEGPFAQRPGQQLFDDPQLPASDHEPALRSLCASLLARQPSQRPASAAEALFALAGAAGLAEGRVERSLAGAGLPEPLLLGRERLRERLWGALADLDQGHGGRTLVLRGPHGSGRSRLLEELRREARLKEIPVIVGLTPLYGEQPADTPPPEDATAERAAVVDGLLSRLLTLAPKPTLVLLDDADEPLALALLELLARRAQPKLLVCAGLLEETALTAELETLKLQALSAEQSAQLADSMVPAPWRDEALGARLHAASGGSPGRAAELLRVVAAARIARGPQAVPDLARAIEEGLAAEPRRLTHLPAPLLRAAAFLGLFPEGLSPSARAAQGDLLAPPLCDALLLQGIAVDGGEGALQLRRGLVESLLARLGLAQRVSLINRALELLAEDDLCARALVRCLSQTVADDPEVVIAGARQARGRGDLGVAARLYEAALELHGLDERPRLQRELAALRLVLGQAGLAIAVLEAAWSEALDGPEREDLVARLADAHLRAGDLEAGLARLDALALDAQTSPRVAVARAKLLVFAGRYDEALDVAETLTSGAAAEPTLRAEVAYTCGLAAMYLGHLDEAEAALGAASEQARAASDALLIARAQNSLGMLQQRRSRFDAAQTCYERCVTIAREQAHLPFEASFLQNLASVLQQQGKLPAALATYRQSLALARRFGGNREMAQVEHNLARLLCQLGHLDEAEQRARRSSQLGRGVGLEALAGQNEIVLAEIALGRERYDQLGEHLQSAQALVDASDAVASTDVALVRARGALSQDSAQEAKEALVALDDESIIASQRIERALLLGRAELALTPPEGSPSRARELLRGGLRLAEDTGEVQVLPELHEALAVASARLSDGTAARLHREAATEHLEANVAAIPAEHKESYLSVPSRARLRRRLGAPVAVSSMAAPSSPEEDEPATPATQRREPEPPRRPPRHDLVASPEPLDNQLLAALLEVNKALNAAPELERLLELIVDHAVDLAEAERGFLLMREGDELAIRVARNLDQETIRNKAFKISRGIAEEVLQSGQPTLTVDAMQDERFAEQLSVHQLRLRSVLCVPLTVRRQLRGAIYLDNRFRSQAFARQQQRLIAALAEQAGLALGTWELMEDNRRRQNELERLNDELGRLNSQLEATAASQREQLAELSDLARCQRDALSERHGFDNLIGRSAPMEKLFALMARVKDSDTSVLIQGESGTGKEVVARALHFAGARAEGPFVGINCAALPSTLLDSELFGYVRGAFTGAERDRRGLIERADGGTLFLDEVGDMPAELQVKLLRVLQERRFERIGSEEERSSDFRLVAASNKELERLVNDGEMREDLYYRINVIRLELPPLRERRDDIPLLIEFLLERHSANEIALSQAALERLSSYDWPGNVRELENEILRITALGGDVIQPEDLSPKLREVRPTRPLVVGGETLKEALFAYEEEVVKARLAQHGGNVTEAAKTLGMTRVGLHKLLKRHGIR